MARETREESIIRDNMRRSHIDFRKQLSEIAGMNDQTMRCRMRRPQELRLYELRSIIDATNMPDEDVLSLVKGK